eukprot:15335952-Ditylum_brightwellii.AAC.1
MYLWDLLLLQTCLTLNILRTSQTNPQLSAEDQLKGNHDFNDVPLAPPGTRTVTFDDLDERGSWAPHGTEGWYVGPAQNIIGVIPSTCLPLNQPALLTQQSFSQYTATCHDYPQLMQPLKLLMT